LSEATFYACRRRLGQSSSAGASADEPLTFVPIDVRHDTLPPAAPALELVLGNGRLLRIPQGFDPAALRHLLAALAHPSCCACLRPLVVSSACPPWICASPSTASARLSAKPSVTIPSRGTGLSSATGSGIASRSWPGRRTAGACGISAWKKASFASPFRP